MKILHTEASTGWGGQEIRILTESVGMRDRGHSIVFATEKGAKLAEKAREAGFTVYEIPLKIKQAPSALLSLIQIIRRHNIEIVNTHSSSDAWLGGIAAKLTGRKVLRTRHLSNPIKEGMNSLLLYNWLADFTATTCEETAVRIRLQARVSENRCRSIPTGIDQKLCRAEEQEKVAFRQKHSIAPDDIVIGTLCVLRSWKGISDLLQAAALLRDQQKLKWLIVGDGTCRETFQEEASRLGISDRVIFAGYQNPPYPALAAMDIFTLLSTRSEGVSQSALQAALLQKPLITSDIGGLPEICLNGKTGFCVPAFSPESVAGSVQKMIFNPLMQKEMGMQARRHVLRNFSLSHTLDGMEEAFKKLIEMT